MTIDQLKKVANKEKINTLNDWGFGGETGILYKYKNIVFLDNGFFYCRHLPKYKIINFSIGDKYFNNLKEFKQELLKIQL